MPLTLKSIMKNKTFERLGIMLMAKLAAVRTSFDSFNAFKVVGKRKDATCLMQVLSMHTLAMQVMLKMVQMVNNG